jgi:hypothetical protein
MFKIVYLILLHAVFIKFFVLFFLQFQSPFSTRVVISITNIFVRFQVLTAASMKIAFWDIASCSLVEVDRRFRDAYCLHHPSTFVLVSLFYVYVLQLNS